MKHIFVPASFADKRSLLLDGLNQFATAGNLPSLDFEYNQPFSVSVWVWVSDWKPYEIDFSKMEVIGKVSEATIPDSQFPHRGWHLRVIDNGDFGYRGRACFYLVSSFDNTHGIHYMGVTTPDYSIPRNRWVHIVAVNTNGTAAGAKIYIDGVSQTLETESDNVNATIKNSAAFTLGSRNEVENYLNGRVNDPVVFDYAVNQNDVNILSSASPTDIAKATFSGGPPISYWRTGDGDVAPLIKDRIGNAHLTMMNGASFISNTQCTSIIADPTWTPEDQQTGEEGDLHLWMDGPDSSTYSASGGAVSEWRDKSPNEFVYAEATNKPTLSTLNGLTALASNGTQYLVMQDAEMLMNKNDRFILGIACSVNAVSGYPGVILDGDGVNQNIKIGFSNDTSSGGYHDFYFGTASGGFARVRWTFNLVAPDTVIIIIEYLQPNSTAGFTATVNGTERPTQSAGGFGPQTAVGRLFSIVSDTLNGKIGEIVLIKNHSKQVAENVKYYLPNKWAD